MLDVPRAAHGGHLRAERLRDLHGERAHAAGGPVDQHLLPGLELALVTKSLERRERCDRDRRRLLERHVRPASARSRSSRAPRTRARRRSSRRRPRRPAGTRSRPCRPPPRRPRSRLRAGRSFGFEPAHRGRADAGPPVTGTSPPGSPRPRGPAPAPRRPPAPACRSRASSTTSGGPNRSRTTAFIVPARRSRVKTTFPVFCQVSTYLVASTTSSSGYVRSMTARYLPASISSLRKRTFSFVRPVDREHDLPVSNHRVRTASGEVVAGGRSRRRRPPGSSERRQRKNECLPTASRMTSYVSPFFVKSSRR